MMLSQLLAVVLCCVWLPRGLLAQRAKSSSSSSSSVTCDEHDVAAAATFVVRHINDNHKHGFKFKLRELLGSSYQQIPGGCRVDVHVKLVQTKCHVSNPKPHEQCEPFEWHQRGAASACAANLWVTWGVATVTRYYCTTRPEPTNEDLHRTCPQCSMLLPLGEPTAVDVAHEAARKFNREGSHKSSMALMEVTHVMTRYVPSTGALLWLEFALVETNCPREATHTFAPCMTLCPERAHHAYCKLTYYYHQKDMRDLSCEMYPPKISAQLPAGMAEPTCVLFHQRPEAMACKQRLFDDQPAIHQICPFPLAALLQRQQYSSHHEQWVKG